jgi:hypothetical protein
MKRAAIAAIVVFVVAGTTAVYAQHWPGRWHGFSRATPDDMSALADARIAAIKVGLRLTAEQESLWPPVEAAARELAKQRIDRIAARREDSRDRREPPSPDELFDRFKRRADNMTASAAGMKKLAEAAEPLYRSLTGEPEAPPGHACRADRTPSLGSASILAREDRLRGPARGAPVRPGARTARFAITAARADLTAAITPRNALSGGLRPCKRG